MVSHTVRTSNLAPDHPDVGTPNLALGPVDESDLLAEVEVGSLGVVNTVDLDQTISPMSDSMSQTSFRYQMRIGTWCWG